MSLFWTVSEYTEDPPDIVIVCATGLRLTFGILRTHTGTLSVVVTVLEDAEACPSPCRVAFAYDCRVPDVCPETALTVRQLGSVVLAPAANGPDEAHTAELIFTVSPPSTFAKVKVAPEHTPASLLVIVRSYCAIPASVAIVREAGARLTDGGFCRHTLSVVMTVCATTGA
jgi:hypothetical protein